MHLTSLLLKTNSYIGTAASVAKAIMCGIAVGFHNMVLVVPEAAAFQAVFRLKYVAQKQV